MQRLTSAEQMKLGNTRLVLHEIYEHPGICRKEITTNTGLSSQTVTNLVKELLSRGIVREEEWQGQLQRGRVPVELRFCTERYQMLTAEASNKGIEVTLHTLDGSVIARESAPLTDGKGNLDALCRISAALAKQCRADNGSLLAEVISVEGVVNETTGMVLRATVMAWVQVNLREALHNLGIPILVQNDVNLVAQSICLRGKANQNGIVVKLDNGVGSAFVINGKMLRSINNVAGEMGHVTVHSTQEHFRCPCGKTNCLTQFISIPSLERRYGKPVATLYQDCLQGRPEACEMVFGIVDYLAPILANLVGLLDLDAVFFIGRSVELFKPFIFPAIEKEIRAKLSSWSSLKDIYCLEDYDIISAAALVVMDDYFSQTSNAEYLFDE